MHMVILRRVFQATGTRVQRPEMGSGLEDSSDSEEVRVLARERNKRGLHGNRDCLFGALGPLGSRNSFPERTGRPGEELRGAGPLNTRWCFHRIPVCRADWKGPGQKPGAWLGGCCNTAHHQTLPEEKSHI